MTTLQDDFLEIYNSLVVFSKEVLQSPIPTPLKVWYEKDYRMLVFEIKGKSVRLQTPVYYTLGLEDLEKPTYLLPEDYDYLMLNLQTLINSGELIKDRTCLSPEDYGFDIYSVDLREMQKGPEIRGQVRFISGLSWWFKFKTKLKYKL